MQNKWANSYGTGAVGEYAGRSYWLCTYNWSGQSSSYPYNTSVYNKIGGFSNGYVPLFIIVGFQNKVYWDNNSYNFDSALQQAINEMVAEGVYVDNPFADQVMIFNDSFDFDVSGVFKDLESNPVTVSVGSNSNPDLISASVQNNTLYLTAGNSTGGTATITLLGTAGEFSKTDEFTVTVYDPVNYTTEDFETGDYTYIPWVFGGNASWNLDTSVFYDGEYSSKSGTITHSQKSQMSATVNYPDGGKIRFFYKTSSESGYDKLKFSINGIEKKNASGNLDWREIEFDVAAGSNLFTWSYEKDATTTSNLDCVWVDRIVFQGGTLSSIENMSVPEKTVLHQNYPNPFNPSTTISFDVTENAEYFIKVFSIKGQLVESISAGLLRPGRHYVNFNSENLSGGIYYYHLEYSGIKTAARRMLLLK
ncbi:MAG TPA: hypothetical protein PKW56_03810 [Clostridiales bacterium]|nr:hypothetical protein [Clostridiales bacterium]